MSTSTRHFTRHYLEMIAGMVIIGIPAEGALHLVGSSSLRLQDDAPAIALLGMATMMTIPTFGVIAVPATGVSDDFGALMVNRARRDASGDAGGHAPALRRVRRLPRGSSRERVAPRD